MALPESTLIYDIEIKNAIRTKNEPPIGGIQYCNGWGDVRNMGVACIGVYTYIDNRYRVFCDDNMRDFTELYNNTQFRVGFNNIGFDNRVLHAEKCIPECVIRACSLEDFSETGHCDIDLLQLIWKAAGHDPLVFDFSTHAGYGLDACCKANFGTEKSGNGALAPVWYQKGEYGKLIDYCLNDIYLTKMLYEQIVTRRYIIDPKTQMKVLYFT